MSVRVSQQGAVALVTLESDNGLNILDFATMRELRRLLRALAGEGQVRALILTGGGERAFSAGADIRYMAGLDATEADSWVRLGHEVGALLETMQKVTIAAISGLASGGGLELALACDLRLASSGATFAQPEVNIGLIPGWGATQRLPRVTSVGFAKDMILTGRTVAAEEALRRGLVSEIADPVLPRALQLADTVAAKSAAALAAAIALCTASLGDLRESHALEADRFAKVFAGADAREGLNAFLEKRAPRFG